MARTKRTKKKPATRVNWKQAAIDLASCAIFTLKFYKHLGKGTGAVFNFKEGKSEGPWEEKFFNALDQVGYKIDRKKYYAMMNKPEKRRRSL